MLVPGKSINVFKTKDVVTNGSWFTGHVNTQNLDFDPLVTGYAFIYWTKLPFWVDKAYPNFKEMSTKNFKSFEGLSDIELQTGQYAHSFNGNNYEYATTITKGNTDFTLRHQEYSGSPIKNMYQYWISGIRDPETDIAVYPRAFGCEYGAKNHTGELMYIMTRPDANNTEKQIIEFSAYYTAVFPTKIPISHLGFTLATHDSPEIDINFKGDMHIGPEVDEFAYDIIKNQDIYTFVTSAYFNPKEGQNLRSEITASSNATVDSTMNKISDTPKSGIGGTDYNFKVSNGNTNQPIKAGTSDQG